ncbi:MAG: hypothetical protein ACUVQ0_00420 [Thermoproteota archaeon]
MPRDFNARINSLLKSSYRYLRKQEDVKYNVLREISSVVKMCRQSMKASYAQDFKNARKLLSNVQREIRRITRKAGREGIYHTWPPIIQAHQEFLEAVFVYWFTSGKDYSIEAEPPPVSILYAISDFIGELKRVMLERLKEGKLDEAKETYMRMVQLYGSISTMALGNSVLPGFKRKVDVNRASVESAFAILNEEQRRQAFLSSLRKKLEE